MKKEQKPYCFVSIPFDSQESPAYAERIFSVMRQALEERGYAAKRLDTLENGSPPIEERLQDVISNSSFVIALVSENNNIIFEVGVSVGLGKDVILLAPSGFLPPYDLSGMPTVLFDESNIEELQEKLSVQISNLHNISSRKGNYSRSLRYLEHALALAKERKNDRDIAAVLNNLSTISYERGDLDKALSFLEESLSVHGGHNDPDAKAATLNNLAQIHVARGAYDEALGYLYESLAISTKTGNGSAESANLTNIGQILLNRGDIDQARECFEKSLEISRALGDRSNIASSLNNLGQLFIYLGHYDHALELLHQAAKIQKEMDDLRSLSTTYHNIATIETAFGKT